jgi:hypothetical protein
MGVEEAQGLPVNAGTPEAYSSYLTYLRADPAQEMLTHLFGFPRFRVFQ